MSYLCRSSREPEGKSPAVSDATPQFTRAPLPEGLFIFALVGFFRSGGVASELRLLCLYVPLERVELDRGRGVRIEDEGGGVEVFVSRSNHELERIVKVIYINTNNASKNYCRIIITDFSILLNIATPSDASVLRSFCSSSFVGRRVTSSKPLLSKDSQQRRKQCDILLSSMET